MLIMLCIHILCPALLAAAVQTLSIDSQLGTSIEDCFERISIGEQLQSNAIYRNVSELTTRECEQICKQDKQCQTYDYGVGAKGNATCDLSNKDKKELKEKGLLNRHPDYDVYIRRFQCEQSPPSPLQAQFDEPVPDGPLHRPVFRPELDDPKRPLFDFQRPQADDFPPSDSRPFETTRPDNYRPFPPFRPPHNNHLDDRPDDYTNLKPDYDRPPSYGDHRPQDVPFRPERPGYTHKPDPYDVLQFQDQHGRPPRPQYRPPESWRPDPMYPPHPADELQDIYGPKPNRPRPHDPPYIPGEKPQFTYITRPNRKPAQQRPQEDAGYGNTPSKPVQDYPRPQPAYGSGPEPIGPPERPYKPSRPHHDRPTYDYQGQYASNYGQNQYQDNSIYVEIYDPPSPYRPSKPSPNKPGPIYYEPYHDTSGLVGYGYGSSYSSQNYAQSQNSHSHYYGSQQDQRPSDNYNQPSQDPVVNRPQKPLHDSESSGYGGSESSTNQQFDQSYGSQSSGYGSAISQIPHETTVKPSYGNQGSYESNQGSYGSNQSGNNQGSYTSNRPSYSTQTGNNQGYGSPQSSTTNRPSYGSVQEFSQFESQSSYGSSQSQQSSYVNRPQSLDRPPYGDHHPSDIRPGYGDNRPSSNNRPSYGVSPSSDIRPAYGVSPSSNNRPAYGVSSSSDNRPAYGVSSSSDNRPAYGVSSSSDNRPAYGVSSSSDNRPAYGVSSSSDNRPAYGVSPSSDNKPVYGADPSSNIRPSYGENRPSSNNRPSYGESRPPSDNRPGYESSQPTDYGYGGSRPGYDDSRPSYGDNRPYDRPLYGDRPPIRPGYGNNRPSYGDIRPSTDDRPAYGNNRPSDRPERPGYGYERPSEVRPSYVTNKPQTSDSSQNSGYGPIVEDNKNAGHKNQSYTNQEGYRPDVKPVYEFEMDRPNNVPSYIVRPSGEVITSRPVTVGDYGKPGYGREPEQTISYKACFRRVLAGKRTVRSHVRKLVPCERLDDCRRECASERRFHCESFNYRLDPSFRGKGLCELMTKPIEAFDLQRDFVEDKDYDFYEIDRNSLEPNCPETLRGPGLLHSGFLTSKPDREIGWDRSSSSWYDERFNRNRNRYYDRGDKNFRRRPEDNFVPYQIGIGRSNEGQESWGQYGGSYGNDIYYKDRNDHHKSIHHWGLTDIEPGYGVRGQNSNFNYNDLGRKDERYGYGSWKRGRWNTSGTGNGLDYGESNYYKRPKPVYYEPVDRSDDVKDCSSRRRAGMSLGSGAIRRSLIAQNVVECEAACFNEREFKCVSYSYRYSSSQGTDNCFLSERPYRGLDLSTDSGSDVYTMPQDQGCSTVSHKPWIESECFWHVRSGAGVSGAAVRGALTVAGLGACEAECIRAHAFFCRGFSFRFDSPTIGDDLENCILTSSPPTSLDTGRGLRPTAGHELYARGNYGRGCEPALYDDTHPRDATDSGECYLQYDNAAKLTGAAVRGQARVRDERACGAACTDAPFRCLSFSYNNNAPDTDNCLLSDIRLFDLQRGVDYQHSADDWLFAFDLFNGQCWRKVHGKGEYDEPVPELPRPIAPPTEDYSSSSGPSGPPGYLPAPPDTHYIPISGPPSGPSGPPGPVHKPHYPSKPYQPDPGFKPSYPAYHEPLPLEPNAGYLPEPGYKPGYQEPSPPGYKPPRPYLPESGYRPGYRPSYPPTDPIRPSYPVHAPSYPAPSAPNYPASGPSYPAPNAPNYPASGPSYPAPGPPNYPESGQRYPAPSGPSYPAPSGPSYPSPSGPSYSAGGPGYRPGLEPHVPIPGPVVAPGSPEQPYPVDRGDEPISVSWRHYTVSGFPCRQGTSCAENKVAGHWACEPEGGEIGSWDYCCAPTHRCGYSEGFDKPWCYVGPSDDQWRPCSEKYYPYHQHNIPHPSQGNRVPDVGRPGRPDDRPPYQNGPGTPYLPEPERQYWDNLYKNGPQAYYDKYGNPLPGYTRVPTAGRPYIKYQHNRPRPGSGHWVPVSSYPGDELPVPGGLGVPRYWPVAYLHKGPPPNMTYFKYNETERTTTTEKYDPRPPNNDRPPTNEQPPVNRPIDNRPVKPQIDPDRPTINNIDNKKHRDEKTRNITNADQDIFQIDIDKLKTTMKPKVDIKDDTEEVKVNKSEAQTETIKPGNIAVDKENDNLKGIDGKLDDFSSSIEVLDIEDAKVGEKMSDLKTLEAEERQIEAIGRLLASRRGGKLVLEKRSHKDLETKSIAIDKDSVDFNFGNRFPTTERRGIIQKVSKDEIEKERNMDKSLEVSETTFVRPPRVLSTTDNIRKAVVNGKVFYDATVREQRDIYQNPTRKGKSLRPVEERGQNANATTIKVKSLRPLEERAPSVIGNTSFGKKKVVRARNVNPVRKFRRVYRRKYNPDEVRRRLLERERSTKQETNVESMKT